MEALQTLEKNMETKKAIRKKILALRKTFTDQQIAEMSCSVTANVCALPAFKNAGRILIYADYNHEVMTRSIIENAWKTGKEVAVPKVEGSDMTFYRLTEFSQLSTGYCGIPEPEEGEIVNWEKGLIIMPGVAFDRKNHRVGYGGGFYDRYLEKYRELDRLALAFSFQIMDQVPTEPTDIFPTILVTEKEIYYSNEEER